MDQTDFERFIKAFAILCEVFEKEASQVLQAAYFKSLERFTIEEVEKSISNAVRGSRFFPRPVELIEYIVGGPQKTEDKAILQAQEVLEAVRRVGGYRSVKFADPITAAVIRQGFDGWSNLCRDMTENQCKWFVKDFSRLYQAYA
jgi:hypothetical protein